MLRFQSPPPHWHTQPWECDLLAKSQPHGLVMMLSHIFCTYCDVILRGFVPAAWAEARDYIVQHKHNRLRATALLLCYFFLSISQDEDCDQSNHLTYFIDVCKKTKKPETKPKNIPCPLPSSSSQLPNPDPASLVSALLHRNSWYKHFWC